MRAFAPLAAIVATAVLTTPAMAASNLTVKGKLVGAKSGTTVILIGNDGSSTSRKVSKKGSFTLSAKGSIAKKVNPKKGRGATLHLLRDGKYVGPILLSTKGNKGYGRFAPKLPKTVKLGDVKVSKKGYAQLKKALAKKQVDTKNSMKLRKGVPLGAGSQGATGSLRTSASARLAEETIPPTESTLGADADKDGVPNLGDVDMNGDQVLDAAQAEQALETSNGTLDGKEVLANRPIGTVSFAKILNNDWRQSVNSNLNPQVSWPTLTGYLAEEMVIETIIPPSSIRELLCGSPDSTCAAALSLAKVTMDCATLSYCQQGAPAIIRAQPGTGLDGKPLSTLLDSAGRIVLPQDSHASGSSVLETGFQLSFIPKATGQNDLQFAGDSFEFTFYDANGNELARQAKVLTSSVAAAPEWASVNGAPAPENLDPQNPVSISGTQPLQLAFVRPQRLSADSGTDAPVLIDRGGLSYSAYMYSSSGNNFYWCRESQVKSTSPDLVNVIPMNQQGQQPMLYDTNLNPPNGGQLSFELDVAGCLSNPTNAGAPSPQAGEILAVEMESIDSDGNRTRSRIYVVLV